MALGQQLELDTGGGGWSVRQTIKENAELQAQLGHCNFTRRNSNFIDGMSFLRFDLARLYCNHLRQTSLLQSSSPALK